MNGFYKVPNSERTDLIPVSRAEWLQWMADNACPYYLADDKIVTATEEICVRTIYTLTALGSMEEHGTWLETWVHFGKPGESHEASFTSTARDTFTEHRSWEEALGFHETTVLLHKAK